MFVDLVFKFCCSKRDKRDSDIQPQPKKEMEVEQPKTPPKEQNFNTFFAQQRLLQNQKNQNPDTSIENRGMIIRFQIRQVQSPREVNSPIDQYFNLDDSMKPKTGSFENIDKQPNQQQEFCPSTENLDSQTKVPISKRIKKNDKTIGENGKEKRRVAIWKPEEDQLLRKYHSEFNGNWKKIAEMIPDRNINQCSQRWRRINPIQGKQKWSFEEDQLVIQLVQKIGKNWTQIAKQMPGRNGKQIRERYLNKLDPELRIEAWNKLEDDAILDLYKKNGPKWSTIASQLKGRSENMVKNRFYSYIRRVVLGETNPYQIVYFSNKKEDGDNSDQHSFGSYYARQPYSENNTFSSGSSLNYCNDTFEDDHYFDEDEQALHDQFMQQANIYDNNQDGLYNI